MTWSTILLKDSHLFEITELENLLKQKSSTPGHPIVFTNFNFDLFLGPKIWQQYPFPRKLICSIVLIETASIFNWYIDNNANKRRNRKAIQKKKESVECWLSFILRRLDFLACFLWLRWPAHSCSLLPLDLSLSPSVPQISQVKCY